MFKMRFVLLAFIVALVVTGAGCTSSSTVLGPMGIFRSSDQGNTWLQANTFPTAQGVKSLAGLKVYRFFTDPSDPNALYVGSRGQGLFYTYNNGDSWQQADPKALPATFIVGLAVDPKDKCVIYVTDYQHLYKTTDCLRTWTTEYTEEQTDVQFVGVAVDYGNSNLLYSALSNGDVLVSADGGVNWRVTKRYPGITLRNILADPLKPGRAYLTSAESGLAHTDDGGVTWQGTNDGFKKYADSLEYYRLVLYPHDQTTTLFWISKYGILRSDDGGATWTDLKLLTAPGAVNIYTFAVDPKDPKVMYYTGTVLNEDNTNARSTFYKSTDGGVNWITKKLPTNTIPVALTVHQTDPNVLFMGFYSGQ